MHSSSILTKRIIQKRLGIQTESEAIQARAKRIVTQQQKQIHAPEELNCQGDPLQQQWGIMEW